MKDGIIAKISSLSPMLEHLLPAINSYKLGNNINSEENPDGEVFRDSLSGFLSVYEDIKGYVDSIENVLTDLKRNNLLNSIDSSLLNDVILELSRGVSILRLLGRFYRDAKLLLEKEEDIEKIANIFVRYYESFRKVKDILIKGLTDDYLRNIFSEKLSIYLPSRKFNKEEEQEYEEWPGEFT